MDIPRFRDRRNEPAAPTVMEPPAPSLEPPAPTPADHRSSTVSHALQSARLSRASARRRTSLVGQRGRSGQFRGPPSSWRARSACTGPCPVPLIRRWGTHRAQARSHQSADGSRAAPTPDSEWAGAGPATAGARDSDQSPEPSRAPLQPGEAVHVCTSVTLPHAGCSPGPRADSAFPAYRCKARGRRIKLQHCTSWFDRVWHALSFSLVRCVPG